MLDKTKPDLMDALGVNVVGLGPPATLLGFKNEGWEPWTFFDMDGALQRSRQRMVNNIHIHK